MKVSVIIPCRNEERYISDCINSLFNNGFDNSLMEIIVIDGQSTDKTLAILDKLRKDFPHLKVVLNPDKITPVALNLGIKHAQGDYIMIASAHSLFSSGYINTLVKNMEEIPDAIAVGGVMKTKVKNETRTSIAIRNILSNKFGVGNAMFRIGAEVIRKVDTVPFGLYKAHELKKSGGYDKRLIRNHDIELSKRLLRNGGSIYLIPDAHCDYFARETYSSMAENNFRNGKWNILTVFLTKTVKSLSIRHFIPLLFVLSLAIPVILSILYFPLIFVSILSLSLYILALIFVIGKEDLKDTSFIHMFWGFFVLHISYGFGSLVGLLMLPKMAIK